jgi:hypothetical protein
MPHTIVDRSADIKAIERSVKNKFKWSWLEEKDEHGDYLSLYISCKLESIEMTFDIFGKVKFLWHEQTKIPILKIICARGAIPLVHPHSGFALGDMVFL